MEGAARQINCNGVKNSVSLRGNRMTWACCYQSFLFHPPPTTTSHPYTTYQRILGSWNRVLERVAGSRGLGKREGIGKEWVSQTRSQFAYQPMNHHHPPSALLPWPHPSPLYLKQRPPMFYSPKLSPGSSIFGFWLQPAPPLA